MDQYDLSPEYRRQPTEDEADWVLRLLKAVKDKDGDLKMAVGLISAAFLDHVGMDITPENIERTAKEAVMPMLMDVFDTYSESGSKH